MRLRAIAFAVLALGAVAAGAHALAGRAAAALEQRTEARVGEALGAAGQDWAEVAADGLILRLSGQAPDEAGRFRTLEIARQFVHPRRVEDRLTVRAAHPSAPPDFALEILRNEAEVSLIGLVPETAGRAAIRDGLAEAGLGGTVTDMLETADFAAPQGWEPSLGFALELLAELPRAKISVGPGQVAVVSVAESPEAKAALESALNARRPEAVALALDISAPRPVIAPFAAEFSIENGAARLAACSAETEADAARIRQAARAAGLVEAPACALGLGAPTPAWAEAVSAGIAAVAELGGGAFAIRDIEAVLTGPDGLGTERLVAVADRLQAALPDIVTLATRLPPEVETRPDGEEVYAPSFRAVLLEDGTVRLTGRLYDATSQAAVQGFAQALFGHDKVMNTTVIDPGLPEGWPGRVLAGVEALALLDEGRLQITPERVALEGSGLLPELDAEAERLLAAKAAGQVAVDIAYDAEAAAEAVAASRPLGEVCAEEIAALLEDEVIAFAPGSSEMDEASAPLLASIAAVLADCPGTRFEIGGHTDSQGSAELNQSISEARAEAVRAALEAFDLPLVLLAARGYGPDRPIADNDTEEGRARNRRIEFTLVDETAAVGEEPAADEEATAEATEAANDPR